jgi:hypothetical protein
MRSHSSSGSARTPHHGVSRRTSLGERGQPTSTSLTQDEAEERDAAWSPHYDYQGALLLATKYTIPPQHTYTIARPRLLDQLDQGLARKLTLVVAPAGYGKTSLLSAWAQQHPSTLAWLTLDATDDDPKRFWLYLIAALDALRPGLGVRALELLSGAPSAPIETVLTVLLNAIADLSDRLIIVLDNYHTISTPAIHLALSFLVEYLPPQLHLVLAGRTTPPLPIARLRARAELSEFGAVDLRVSQDEAAVLLQQKMGLDLATQDVAAMTARTEGWITGLHLAGLALQHEPARGAQGAMVRGSDRYLFDYLIEEVLKQQPQAIQTFLLRTAHLERLNGELCDAVMGLTPDERPMTKDEGPTKVSESVRNADHALSSIVHRPSSDSYSQIILDQLDRANLFIMVLDAGIATIHSSARRCRHTWITRIPTACLPSTNARWTGMRHTANGSLRCRTPWLPAMRPRLRICLSSSRC